MTERAQLRSKKEKGWNAWTEEERALLERLYMEGYSHEEIARALGRTLDSVKGAIKRSLFKRFGPRSKDKKSGLLSLTLEDSLRLLGVEEKEVLRIVKEAKELLPKRKGNSDRGKLSDAEAAMVVYRYLQHTKNLEGATRIWKEHLKYRYSHKGIGMAEES